MGRHGFTISLHPKWRELVAGCDLNEQKIHGALDVLGRGWLDECGFAGMFDPDNCGFQADKKLPPGPNARPMYQPNRDLRVTWGEWGPEHITVPGNACGLDIDRHSFGSILRGPSLLPHNIDNWKQKQLLLVTFCWIAESIILYSESL